jgi:hypothetical protein
MRGLHTCIHRVHCNGTVFQERIWKLIHSEFQVANTLFSARVSKGQYAAAMVATKFNSVVSF